MLSVEMWQIEVAWLRAKTRAMSWVAGVGKGASNNKKRSFLPFLVAGVGLAVFGYKQDVFDQAVGFLPAEKGELVRGDVIPFSDGARLSDVRFGVEPGEDGGPPVLRSARSQSREVDSRQARTQTVPSGASSRAPADFSAAKVLLRKIYSDHRVDEYCGCPFDTGLKVGACGVEVDSHEARASKIEWEHIVPASDFGRQRSCWQNAPAGMSGRSYCRETDSEFRSLEANPYNLMPVIGSLNAIRSNYRYGEVEGEERRYGSCDFEVSAGQGRFVEPPDSIKGDVARTYFYFEEVHGFRIGNSQRRLFEVWDKRDPLSQWETRRAIRIYKETGMDNPVIARRLADLRENQGRPESVDDGE